MGSRPNAADAWVRTVVLLVGLLAVALYLSVGSWMLQVIVPLTVTLALTHRGRMLAIASGVVATLSGNLTAAYVAHATGIPLAMLVATLGGVVVVLCARAINVSTARSWVPHDPGTWWLIGSAALGGIVWGVVWMGSRFLPWAAPTSWALTNDSANNVLFAREMLLDNGLIPAAGNPVPLTQLQAAILMAPQRDSLSAPELAARDLSALGTSWGLTMLGVSVLGAAAVWRIASLGARLHRETTYVAVAMSSLLLHTFVGGLLPVLFGFGNYHLTALLLFSSLLAFLERGRQPVLAAIVLLGLCGLVTATWTPLVLVPAAALLMHVPVWSRSVRADGWVAPTLTALAALWAVGVLCATALPAYLRSSGALSADGGIEPLRWWWFALVVSAVAAIAGAAWTVMRGAPEKSRVVAELSVLGLVMLAGMALLVVMAAGRLTIVWAYYPTKYGWLSVFVLLTVALGFVAMAVPENASTRHRALAVISCAGIGVAALVGGTVPKSAQEFFSTSPAIVVLAGPDAFDSDRLTQMIEALADADEIRIVRDAGTNADAEASFWSMQLSVERISGDADKPLREQIRWFAYYVDTLTDDELCEMAHIAPKPVVIYTDEANLERFGSLDCARLSARPMSDLPGYQPSW